MPNDPLSVANKPGFTSFKCSGRIPYPLRWHRDALVQATLEPSVAQIAALSQDEGDLPEAVEFSFVARMAGINFQVIVSDQDGDSPKLHRQNLTPLRLTRRSLLAEPFASTSRAVWSHKRFMTDPSDRWRIAEEVADLPEGKPVEAIFPLLRNQFLDPLRQLFSLLANGYLAADLTSGLTPRTRLRLGPAAIGTEPVRPRDRLLHPPASPAETLAQQ